MKCPNCGISNGKTNKFCRECGTKLEGVAEPIGELVIETQGLTVCALDDVALGEELFVVMRLYENGELDKAAERVNRIITCSPDSASAHSIKALICERKADLEMAQGNKEVALGYLQSAVAEYEAIIDLNPDSAADREKLIRLRMKIAGDVFPQPMTPARQAPLGPVAKLQEIARTVPPPVLAAGVTMVVLAMLSGFFVFRGAADSAKPTAGINDPQQRQVDAPVTPTGPSQPSGYTNTNSAYTYPTAPTVPTTPSAPLQPVQAAQSVQSPVSGPAPKPSVQPIKLPPLGPELVLVPQPRKTDDRTNPKPRPADSGAGRIVITPSTGSDTPDDTSSSEPDGSSLLARAITLGNQEKYAEAVQSAQQAVQAFRNDLAAGRNTVGAQRGVDLANKYIQRWQSN